MGAQLAKNGFYRVSKNTDWNGQRGDIVMMSWGADMSQSGGAGGHGEQPSSIVEQGGRRSQPVR